jgi:hypothetical protein
MYKFNENLTVAKGFNDLQSQMVKQAVRQARADGSKNVYVSQHWFNLVKPTLRSLVHPAPLGEGQANITCLDTTFTVKAGLGDYDFEVK